LQVLREEFPKGIDIIYESVGGDMLNLCLNALAVHGRLIIIGMISQVFLFSCHATFFALYSTPESFNATITNFKTIHYPLFLKR